MISLESYRIGSACLLNGAVSKLLYQPIKFGEIMEIWKKVKENNLYEVSNYGRVKSWNNRYGKRPKSKYMKFSCSPSGYLYLCIRANGKYLHKRISRLALEGFNGPCPTGMQCCHNDGDKKNNHIENLRWDTPKNNALDRITHGAFKLTHPSIFFKPIFSFGSLTGSFVFVHKHTPLTCV